jgi:hypothetical protein
MAAAATRRKVRRVTGTSLARVLLHGKGTLNVPRLQDAYHPFRPAHPTTRHLKRQEASSLCGGTQPAEGQLRDGEISRAGSCVGHSIRSFCIGREFAWALSLPLEMCYFSFQSK